MASASISIPTRRNKFSNHARGSALVAVPGNSPPAFAFVTHTGPPSKSPSTQRLIRSHVMLQIGKSRRKGRLLKAPLMEFDLEIPPEPDWDEPGLQPLQDHFQDHGRDGLHERVSEYSRHLRQVPETGSSENESRQKEEVFSRIDRFWVGRSDPFARYPIEMNLRAHELVDHIFDDIYGNFKPFRDAWFPIGMLDPAAFHQVLANSALNMSLLRNIPNSPESYEAISHHTCAISLVNKRLSDPIFATSDEVIGAVTAFVCYYHIIGNTKTWRMHMNGIKEIVRLRGGPDSPSFNPCVRLTLSVADINGSCTQDIPPTFPLPPFVPPSPIYPTSIDVPLLSAQTSLAWRTLLPSSFSSSSFSSSTHHPIIAIIDDLTRLTSFLKTENLRTAGRVYRDLDFVSLYINPLLHRLLSLSAPPSSPITTTIADNSDENDDGDQHSILQEAARLAAILYLAPIRRAFGIQPVSSAIQLSKLHSLLSRCSSSSSPPSSVSSEPKPKSRLGFSASLPTLYLWIPAMGFVESAPPLLVSDMGGGRDGGRERDNASLQVAFFRARMFEAAGACAGDAAEEGEMGESESLRNGIRGVLRLFLWVEELHGGLFEQNLGLVREER